MAIQSRETDGQTVQEIDTWQVGRQADRQADRAKNGQADGNAGKKGRERERFI